MENDLKISVLCESILLSRSIELLLPSPLFSPSEAEILIVDKDINLENFNIQKDAVVLVLDRDLRLPFDVRELYSVIGAPRINELDKDDEKLDDFNQQLDFILSNFKNDIINLLKRHKDK